MLIKEETIEIKSRFTMSESLERLRQHVRSDAFSAQRDKPAVGAVNEQEINFYWYPSLGFVSSLKPIFKGHFTEVDGNVILRGSFTSSWPAKGQKTIFAILLGILALFIISTAAIALISHQFKPTEIIMPLFWIALAFIIEYWFFKFIRNAWRREVDLLLELIEDALV